MEQGIEFVAGGGFGLADGYWFTDLVVQISGEKKQCPKKEKAI